MEEKEDKYCVNNVPLHKIRNRNELRVIQAMREVLNELEGYHPSMMDVEDIYALALNLLPPRYVQRGSIVLREEVTDEMLKEKVREAVEVVSTNPKY
ncbi:MAG: late competence development ComFB family protein [SAR324 cluster bacterium]|nr:late competence development ComFB family protein [SAR324 cluster bacterium]